MEEVIKEKPISPDEFWYEKAIERLHGTHDFYQLRYAFSSFSFVSKLEKLVKTHKNLLFSAKQTGGLFIVQITNQNA